MQKRADIIQRLDETLVKLKGTKFYVYCLYGGEGWIAYIGKGSGERLKNQKRRYGLDGHILSWHLTEKDAYFSEMEAIKRLKPALNLKAGSTSGRLCGDEVRDWEAMARDRYDGRAHH